MFTKTQYHVIGSLAIVGTLALYTAPFIQYGHVYKFKMPGRYNVALPADDYTVWNFCDWPSKGVRTKLTNLNLEVIDKDGHLIESHRKTNNRIFHEKADENSNVAIDVFAPFSPNRGRIEDFYNLASQGNYTISSESTSVVVFVPTKLTSMWLDNEDFDGSSDDFNFQK